MVENACFLKNPNQAPENMISASPSITFIRRGRQRMIKDRSKGSPSASIEDYVLNRNVWCVRGLVRVCSLLDKVITCNGSRCTLPLNKAKSCTC